MSDERKQVLDMLAAGKITADEADRLLGALETGNGPATATATAEPVGPKPKFLRILVDATDRHNGRPVHVNVRVPIALLRAGVRLTNFIPAEARTRLNEELAKQGMTVDVTQIRPENLDEVIDQLRDLTIDIDHQGNGDRQENVKVKINAE